MSAARPTIATVIEGMIARGEARSWSQAASILGSRKRQSAHRAAPPTTTSSAPKPRLPYSDGEDSP